MTARPMTEVLEPCPFCGGTNITLRCEMAPPSRIRPWYWAVWCECGARCKADTDVFNGDAKTRAIAAWNRRAVRGMREALEKIANFKAEKVCCDKPIFGEFGNGIDRACCENEREDYEAALEEVQDIALAALSVEGEDEQARGQGRSEQEPQ